jgi:hypothetical protein
MMRSANFLSPGFVFCTVTGVLLILAGIVLFPGEPTVLLRELWRQAFDLRAASTLSVQSVLLAAGASMSVTGFTALILTFLMKIGAYVAAVIVGLRAKEDDSEENWMFI